MATSNNSRDVELNLRVATLGVESLQKLEQEVKSLAADGKIAADAGKQLGDEISRLLANAAEFNNLSRLDQEVRDLADATQRTGAVAHATALDLEQLNTKTIELRESESLLRAASDGAVQAFQEARLEIGRYRDATATADRQTTEYRTNMAGLRQAVRDAAAEIRDRAVALQNAEAATARAAAEEAQMAKALTAATREADNNARALSARNAELRDSRTALEQAGIAATDLAEAERQLIQAQNDVRAATQRAEQTERDRIETLRAEAQEEQRLADIVFRSRMHMADAAKAEADGVIRDFARMEAAEREAAQAAQQTAQQISSAFSTLGTKSVADLRAEIDRVRAAMATMGTTAGLTGPELDRAMQVGQQRIKSLERDIREATGQLTLMDRVTTGLSSTLGQFAAAFTAVDIGQRIGRSFIEANVALEGLRLGLTAIYKDSGTAAKQIDFLYQVANRAGVSITDISPAFTKFTASMSSANVPLAQSNALFAAVSQSAGTLGLSGDKLSHILDALSQMAGKGTVSMEELRQQLGDSLPGALSLTAKGLGITDGELIKLVESGGLLARDLFPALTRSLQSMSSEVNTMQSGWERFKNAMTETFTTIGDAGAVDAMKGALIALGVVVGAVVIPLAGFLEVVFGLAKGLVILLGPVGSFTDRMRGLADIADGAATRLGKLNGAFGSLIFGADKATPALANNAQAAQAVGTAAVGAATAQTTFGTATEQLAAKASLATASIIQLGVRYADLAKQLVTNVEVSEKLVKARQIEGKTLENITKLSGDERAALQAAVQARQGNLEAVQRLAAARDAEVTALRTYIAQLQEEIRLHGDPDGARAKDIASRQQKLAVLDAESEKTKQQVAELKEEVAARKLTAQSYEDNSKSLELLRTVYENTRETLLDYQALQKQGFATQKQVDDAALAAAAAQGLYRDALKDSAAASARYVQSIENQMTVQRSALSLDEARARSLGALARSTGDTNLATQATITLKEIEVKRLLQSADAISKETAEIIRNAQAQRESQIALGSWNPEKQAEYEKVMASAEAKKLDAEASRANAQATQQEINDMRNGIGTRDESTASIERNTDAQKRNNQAKAQSPEATTADGFKKNADGSAAGTFTNNLPVDQAFRLANGQITDLAQAKAAMEQAKNAFLDMQAFSRSSPGSSSFEYQQSTTQLYTKARAEFEKLQDSSAAAANQSTSHTVTLNVAGATSKIGVASAEDGSNLVDMLKKIQDAARSAA